MECSQGLLLHLATNKTPPRAKTRRKAVLSASRLAWKVAQHWAQRLSGQSLWAGDSREIVTEVQYAAS